ncbi:MAG: DUF1501 domain-containing protein [Burkholderiales bacterium]|nr:DUF1501 domain-containing protein [Burkholderiales bacterium]
MMTSEQRRQFLKHASVLGAAGITSPWALNLATIGAASAQSIDTTSYKALVCIFLVGGNDAHNTVLPVDDADWLTYLTARGTAQSGSPIALTRANLLTISHLNGRGLNTGRHFALHPQLKRFQQIYGSGKAAVIANIGPLLQPTSKSDVLNGSFPLPKNLFSHNDQQSTWQSFSSEGAVSGWGGRIMDSLMSRNTNASFASIGVNNGSVWLSGQQAIPYQLSTGGVYDMAGNTGKTFGSAQVYQSVRYAALTSTRDSLLGQAYVKVVNRALSTETALSNALPKADRSPWGTPGTNNNTDPLLQYTSTYSGQATVNPLAQQLQVVARMIEASKNSLMGANRQVFMVTLGGFDTHSNQLGTHADLMAKLDHGIGYFYDTLNAMGAGSGVTTFTASDFGRALNSNGDGTDHGWGAHHLVFGASVKGGDIYGTFPSFTNQESAGNYSSPNLLANGALLPEQSVDQLAYTLGRWMDVSDSDLTGTGGTMGIAPNIGNFDASVRNLGFMG